MTFAKLTKTYFIYLIVLAQNFYAFKADSTVLKHDAVGRSNTVFRTPQSENTLYYNDKNVISNLSPAEEIKSAGYSSETHMVITEDGYILTIFRILGASKGSAPIYLQHGFEESAAGWLLSGKGRSLAYILHDNGYDVWMGNARGNAYSKRHINLTTSDPRFWDFSATEVGTYDLPAIINYITTLSGQKLFYIGHSMGGLFMSIMAIERPDVAEKVKAMIGLAPGVYVNHIKSLPLLLLAPLWKPFFHLTNALNLNEFLPRGERWNAFAKYICGSRLHHALCRNLLYITAGYSPRQLDYGKNNSIILQRFWREFPAGTSVKLYVHLLQQMHSRTKLNKFDYGTEANLQIYNRTLPPAYDLSKMRVPTAVFWADNDIIVVPRDIKDFYSQLPVKLGIYQVPDKNFNHFDYVIGKDAPRLVYSTVLKIMYDFDNQVVNKKIKKY